MVLPRWGLLLKAISGSMALKWSGTEIMCTAPNSHQGLSECLMSAQLPATMLEFKSDVTTEDILIWVTYIVTLDHGGICV